MHWPETKYQARDHELTEKKQKKTVKLTQWWAQHSKISGVTEVDDTLTQVLVAFGKSVARCI